MVLHFNGAAFALIVTKMFVTKNDRYKKCSLQIMTVTNYLTFTSYLPVTPTMPVPGGVDDVPWLSA
jgi:hypothetical protein